MHQTLKANIWSALTKQYQMSRRWLRSNVLINLWAVLVTKSWPWMAGWYNENVQNNTCVCILQVLNQRLLANWQSWYYLGGNIVVSELLREISLSTFTDQVIHKVEALWGVWTSGKTFETRSYCRIISWEPFD